MDDITVVIHVSGRNGSLSNRLEARLHRPSAAVGASEGGQ